MLVVIAIIGILAAMIFPVTKGVNRTRIKSRARTEMEQIVTALELYKAKRGQYPPDNHLPNGQPNPYLNQLYYELAGTTNWMSNPAAGQATYQTLDGRSVIASHAISVALGSGVAGFVNSASGGSSEEGSTVVDCLRGALRPDQLGQVPVQGLSGVYFNVLVCSVPLSGLPAAAAGVAPYPGSAQVTPNSGAWCCAWRYNSSSPTHNPTSYDLWVDLIIDGRTNRFSNWSRNAVVVSSP
jgi:type II secretory pathway pseudopilin PulG